MTYQESLLLNEDSEQVGWYVDWLAFAGDIAKLVAIYLFMRWFVRLIASGWFNRKCGACCDKLGQRGPFSGLKFKPTAAELAKKQIAVIEEARCKIIREVAAKKYGWVIWNAREQGTNYIEIRNQSVLSYYDKTIDGRSYIDNNQANYDLESSVPRDSTANSSDTADQTNILNQSDLREENYGNSPVAGAKRARSDPLNDGYGSKNMPQPIAHGRSRAPKSSKGKKKAKKTKKSVVDLFDEAA